MAWHRDGFMLEVKENSLRKSLKLVFMLAMKDQTTWSKAYFGLHDGDEGLFLFTNPL
ncbi:hypothetical protein [Heyndrickxia acidicola]|uniref:Uncharacterized protein n=1 Tax=Heyndrickxia acidicola TaxID=209389 RepID=A0ABU6MJ94_9BACI|nr:hypothetical protein [Heyndrickxia acidicola]MED1203115.1 hypothetical protein [Heyndrickxia acidicola]